MKKHFASSLTFIHAAVCDIICVKGRMVIFALLKGPPLCQRTAQKFLLLPVAKELLPHSETARKAEFCPISPGHSLC